VRRPRVPGLAFASLVVAVLFVACGARTGLYGPSRRGRRRERRTCRRTWRRRGRRSSRAGPRRPGRLPTPPTRSRRPRYVWKCGERIIQCSSLEQCEESEAGTPARPLREPVPRTRWQRHGRTVASSTVSGGHEEVAASATPSSCQPVEDREPRRSRSPGEHRLPLEQFAASVGAGHRDTYGVALPPASPQPDRHPLPVAPSSASKTEPRDPAPRQLSPRRPPAIAGDARSTAPHGYGVHIKTTCRVAYQMLLRRGSARVTG